jgi:hypothetical protein
MNLPVFPTRPRHSLSMSRFRAPILTLRYGYRALMILTLFATLFTPQMATATVVVPVAERDMTRQASVIVIGTITKLKSSWDKNHQQIFTKITLSVDEVLKSNLKKRRLTVTQFGGVVDSSLKVRKSYSSLTVRKTAASGYYICIRGNCRSLLILKPEPNSRTARLIQEVCKSYRKTTLRSTVRQLKRTVIALHLQTMDSFRSPTSRHESTTP